MSSIASPTTPTGARGALPSLRATGTRAGRDLLYLTIGLATGTVGFVVWLAGLIVTGVLLPFVIGLPVALAFAAVMRWAASLDRRNAVVAGGPPIAARYAPVDGFGLLGRLRITWSDPQTWKDLAWLVLHSLTGFGFGCWR